METIFVEYRDRNSLRRVPKTKEYVLKYLLDDNSQIQEPYQITVSTGKQNLYNTIEIKCVSSKILVCFNDSYDWYQIEVDSVEEGIDLAIKIAEDFRKLKTWKKVFNAIETDRKTVSTL